MPPSIRLPFAVVLLFTTFFVTACEEKVPMMRRRGRTAAVIVGAVLPLTGPQAAYGVATKSGIDLAVREQNDSGGVLGMPVRVVYLDDRGDSAQARQAAERLVVKENAKVLIGPSSSEPARAMAQVAVRAKVPMITPSATAPDVTQQGPFVFRVCYVDPFQARAMARFARTTLNVSSVGVLRDLGQAYSVRLADAFEAEFKAHGGTITKSATYLADDKNFETVLRAMIEAKVLAIYLPGYGREITRITKEARALGYEGRFLGADGWDSREVLSAGAAVEGAIFTTHFTRHEPRPEVAEFEKNFVHAMNEAPDAMAALGYDAARFVLLAIQRAESVDGEVLREALANAPAMVGATGAIALDPDRNAIKPVVVVEIKDGQTKFVASVGPPAKGPSVSTTP